MNEIEKKQNFKEIIIKSFEEPKKGYELFSDIINKIESDNGQKNK